MKIYKLIIVTLLSTIFLFSCGNDELAVPVKYVPKGTFDSGVLVLNQGNAIQNASLSFISFDLNTIKNNYLKKK